MRVELYGGQPQGRLRNEKLGREDRQYHDTTRNITETVRSHSNRQLVIATPLKLSREETNNNIFETCVLVLIRRSPVKAIFGAHSQLLLGD